MVDTMKNIIVSRLIIAVMLLTTFIVFPFDSSAETKNPDLVFEEGQRLLSDSSDPQNVLKGISLIIVAANEGSPKAMIEIGSMYTSGLGRLLSDDFEDGTAPKLALSWYEKAAESGEPDLAAAAISSDAFAYFLGSEERSVQEDDAVALEYLQKAAELGDPSAINMMVAFYIYGFGVDQDYDKALELCSSLADKGDAEALYSMEDYAYAFYAGTKDGLDINFSTAFKYYEKLTEYGNERAMYNLGLLYEYGLGTSRDHVKAVEWLTKALDNGYEPAKSMLDSLENNK